MHPNQASPLQCPLRLTHCTIDLYKIDEYTGFMPDTHSIKKITKNSFLYTVALIIQKVISTVYFWYYSTHLRGGASDVGRLQFVLSFVTLFFILGDLGLYLVFLRESSKNPEKTNSYLNTIAAIKIPLFVCASVIVCISGFFLHRADFLLIVYGLIWIMLDNATAYLYAVLRARQNLLYESFSVIGTQLLVAGFGVTALILSRSISYLILALITGTAINFLFILMLVVYKYKLKIRIKYDPAIGAIIWKSVPAFAVAGIVVKALNSIDVVLLQKLTSSYELVGFYSIPLKLINAVSLTVPTALMGAIYPAFSHLYGKSEDGLRMIFKNALDYLMIISVPIAVGFFALGDEFIHTLWKTNYDGAISPAKLMLFSLPFIFLAFPTGNLLNATGRQAATAISRLTGLVALIILDIILIPMHGIVGAAIALILTHFIILLCDLFYLRSIVAQIAAHIVLQIVKVIASAGFMYVVIYAMQQIFAWYVLGTLGAAAYFFALILMRGINLRIVKFLR